MAIEKFINGKVDRAHHVGKHSTIMRLQAAFSQLREYRQERTVAHEQGHVEPLPLDVEVVLFELHPPMTREEQLIAGAIRRADAMSAKTFECMDTKAFDNPTPFNLNGDKI